MRILGEITGNLARIAISISRHAAKTDGVLVWVSRAGIVACAHVGSDRAQTVLAEATDLVVGTYGLGARAIDIADDLADRKGSFDA